MGSPLNRGVPGKEYSHVYLEAQPTKAPNYGQISALGGNGPIQSGVKLALNGTGAPTAKGCAACMARYFQLSMRT